MAFVTSVFTDLEFIVGDGLPPLVDYPGGGSTREWPRSLDGALSLDFDTAIRQADD